MSSFLLKNFLPILFIILTSCRSSSNEYIYKHSVLDYPDILNIKNIPDSTVDWSAFSFSDRGAWFSFALPEENNPVYYGTFPGPFLMTQGKWLSDQLITVVLKGENGIDISPNRDSKKNIIYYPGYLHQRYEISELILEQNLHFISDRSAVIETTIYNTGSNNISLSVNYRGQVFEEMARIEGEGNNILVVMENNHSITISAGSSQDLNNRVSDDSLSFVMENPEIIDIGPEENYKTSCAISYFMGEPGKNVSEKNYIKAVLSDPRKYINENKHRWNIYLDKILDTESPWHDKKVYKDIAVKSLLTLVNNWRSAYGDLKHEGLFPSYAVWYFNGFWAWDSWKHAVALARFEPELAKNQILALFDYQDEFGMIADCIFADKKENNYRDTKPPLAAWAVMEVFKYSNDYMFLREIYPKLLKYHKWWYENRDHDQNGLCEYGSVDGTKVAAMWESGWDDAVRFDDSRMLKNNENAWSLDQESADLNSYLYADKLFLSSIASLLGENDTMNELRDEAEVLGELIRSNFYDENSGYFYDKKIKSNKLIPVKDPGGWIPLWAGAASEQQAYEVNKIICDTAFFNTFVPLPTVSGDNKKFMSGYWRGAVWIDQAYFGIKGLLNYGYENEAVMLTNKLFDNCEGLSDSHAPLRENYHPVTGEGLKVNHFSWTAAHLLLLFRGE